MGEGDDKLILLFTVEIFIAVEYLDSRLMVYSFHKHCTKINTMTKKSFLS